MHMRQAIFAGSFDPLTTGHLWMIQEGARLFDVLHVLVAVNSVKKAMFPPAERRSIIEGAIGRLGLSNVRVDSTSSEFIAQVANRKGVDYLLRGLRSTSDFDLEDLLRQTNKELFEGPQTVFLIPPKGLSSVSSSFVKALMGPVGWVNAVADFLPEESYGALLETTLSQRWIRLIESFASDSGVSISGQANMPEAKAWFSQHLLPSYQAPGRWYHGLSHLAHCLSEADALAQNRHIMPANQRRQLECAIFFHDLVYRGGPLPIQQGEGDEEASARYAAAFLKDVLSAPPEDCARVEEAVLATRYSVHQESGLDSVSAWMRDVDLSMLGRPPKEYAQYATAVRKEYADIPDAVFSEARARILAVFLDMASRDELFTSNWFRERSYNRQASENLASEISSLRSQG